MKVILLQDVKGKGKKGASCWRSPTATPATISLPRNLAVEANADNMNTMRMNDKATAERQAKERAEAMEIMKKMKTFTLTGRRQGRRGRAAVRRRDRDGWQRRCKSRRGLPLTSGRSPWRSPSKP